MDWFLWRYWRLAAPTTGPPPHIPHCPLHPTHTLTLHTLQHSTKLSSYSRLRQWESTSLHWCGCVRGCSSRCGLTAAVYPEIQPLQVGEGMQCMFVITCACVLRCVSVALSFEYPPCNSAFYGFGDMGSEGFVRTRDAILSVIYWFSLLA